MCWADVRHSELGGILLSELSQPAPAKSGERYAPSVLLMGDINTGKTTAAVRSLVKQGVKVRYLACEPGYEDVIGDIPPDMLAWNYVPPVQDDMTITADKVKLIQTLTDKQLKEMGGVNKARHTQLLDLMKLVNNFVDMRTGQSLGSVADWGDDVAFVMDGLSGLTQMAIKVKIGDKPFMEVNDYYAVQSMLRDFINTLVTNTKCIFVMTAHIEYEDDPVRGGKFLMPSTAGKALAPEIGRYFSDVILCKKDWDPQKQSMSFRWDNVDPNAKLKARNLKWGDRHPADFKPLLDHWKAKGTQNANT